MSAKFPRKIRGNSGGFLLVSTVLQSENLCFCCYKTYKNPRKFQENFREISEIPKMCENFPRKIPENFPENSRKIGMFYNRKCNGTARKAIFLFL